MSNNQKVFDFEDRAVKFCKAVIEFCRALNRDNINQILVNQIVRSASSIGANYCEANEAVYLNDLIHKLSISKKEARETKYWLRVIIEVNGKNIIEARQLWTEADELTKILAAMIRNAQAKK